ncbi:MAG TPA: hypothetical protein VI423_01990, partial [Paenisporosarcina sp.]|nr:hypothetical protein [Paenisporosarcina sp.]
KEILGYTKMRKKPHQNLCDFVEDWSQFRKKCILLPRGSFKSSVVTVGYSLYSLMKNPNLRILVGGETQKNAKKFVKEIKTHLESNEKFKAIFGDWVSYDNIWRDDEFIISKRTAVKKESTVMAASLEKQSTTSQHYDLIFLDDPCSQNNINTPEQIEKTINYYKLLLSVLEPDGKIIVIGTRYSPLDLYGWLCDGESPEKDQISILCKEAIDDSGELLFPEVLTRKFLDEQRQSQGPWTFQCQYMNRPMSPDTCYFKQEWVKFYEKPPPGLIYFITLDAALSKGERSDYTAFIVNGVDYKHNWYIQEAIQGKFSPHESVTKLFELVEKYKPMCVGMERSSFEQMLEANIKLEWEKGREAFPLKELPIDTRVSKEARIRSLQPRFQNGQIYIRKDQTALLHQILYYPLGTKNDDLLDALKSQLNCTFPSEHSYEESKEEDLSSLCNADRRKREELKAIPKIRHVRQKKYMRF